MLSNFQVVERERNDSKAEQERLNTQIQETLKEVEVILIKTLFLELDHATFFEIRA